MVSNLDRKALLLRIQMCCFVLNDLNLFLDTHPDNQMALEHFRKNQEMLREAQADYIARFGPLQAKDYMGGERWNWVDGPWPWEMGGNA